MSVAHAHQRAMAAPCKWAAGKGYADAMREHVGMLNALDAPFDDMKRRKFDAVEVAAPRSGAASSTGLVSYATKAPRARERHLIDRDGSRCRRMRRAIGHSARLLHFDATGEKQRYRKTFITLTYREGADWEAGHVRQFLRRMRRWFETRGAKIRFVWVAELQKRGALHYHVLVWVPRRFLLPKPDKRGWWPHGSSNIKEAQHAVSYIAKYASKTTPDQAARYPNGARMHGAGGLNLEARREVRYWQAPEWVRDALTGRADIRKVVGGYCNKFNGEFLPSPWKVEVTPGGFVYAWRYLPEEKLQ